MKRVTKMPRNWGKRWAENERQRQKVLAPQASLSELREIEIAETKRSRLRRRK